jgi:hypothetical protein
MKRHKTLIRTLTDEHFGLRVHIHQYTPTSFEVTLEDIDAAETVPGSRSFGSLEAAVGYAHSCLSKESFK